MSSSYCALQISLFVSEDTALAFNATLTVVLIAIRELEGMQLSSLRLEVWFGVGFFF